MGKLEYLEFQEGGVAVWPARKKNVASGPPFRMRGEANLPASKKCSPGGGPRGLSGHSVEKMGQIFLVNLL